MSKCVDFMRETTFATINIPFSKKSDIYFGIPLKHLIPFLNLHLVVCLECGVPKIVSDISGSKTPKESGRKHGGRDS